MCLKNPGGDDVIRHPESGGFGASFASQGLPLLRNNLSQKYW